MSLSGNLGFVSLDEVLRLLNRSNQRGMVDVRGDGVDGRIFFERGGVTLATTLSDDSLAAHLSRSETPDGAPMASLLREMAVEAIYQLSSHGRTFEVAEQRTPSIASTSPFDLEELLGDARRRYDEWTEVSSVVTDLDSLLRMKRDLGERDRVTLDRDSWRLLSEIGAGASVRTLAKELGTTDFWAARVAAGMMGEDLLQLNGAASQTADEMPATTVEPEWSEPEWPVEPVAAPHQADETVGGIAQGRADEFATPVFAEEPVEVPTAATETSAEDEPEVDPNASWWTEPKPEVAAANEENQEAAKDDGEVEEGTEAFLEKVFSGLESGETPEEGYGLLRRRRLGALRDLSNDS